MLHPSSYGYPRSITSRAGPATRRKSGSPGERPQAGRGTLASAGGGRPPRPPPPPTKKKKKKQKKKKKKKNLFFFVLYFCGG
ncbi:hypothetical protein ABMZ99_29340, partial [Pseudomonas aeruginosa]|uniref:hypothetical protein n=1 Tax=Pseudomonas aeruginosa TaxID=287 RepID=UPI0039BEB795